MHSGLLSKGVVLQPLSLYLVTLYLLQSSFAQDLIWPEFPIGHPFYPDAIFLHFVNISNFDQLSERIKNQFLIKSTVKVNIPGSAETCEENLIGRITALRDGAHSLNMTTYQLSCTSFLKYSKYSVNRVQRWSLEELPKDIVPEEAVIQEYDLFKPLQELLDPPHSDCAVMHMFQEIIPHIGADRRFVVESESSISTSDLQKIVDISLNFPDAVVVVVGKCPPSNYRYSPSYIWQSFLDDGNKIKENYDKTVPLLATGPGAKKLREAFYLADVPTILRNLLHHVDHTSGKRKTRHPGHSGKLGMSSNNNSIANILKKISHWRDTELFSQLHKDHVRLNSRLTDPNKGIMSALRSSAKYPHLYHVKSMKRAADTEEETTTVEIPIDERRGKISPEVDSDLMETGTTEKLPNQTTEKTKSTKKDTKTTTSKTTTKTTHKPTTSKTTSKTTLKPTTSKTTSKTTDKPTTSHSSSETTDKPTTSKSSSKTTDKPTTSKSSSKTTTSETTQTTYDTVSTTKVHLGSEDNSTTFDKLGGFIEGTTLSVNFSLSSQKAPTYFTSDAMSQNTESRKVEQKFYKTIWVLLGVIQAHLLVLLL